MSIHTPLRSDLSIIQSWITNGSQVLDLGCGKGELLNYLTTYREVKGYGLEIGEEEILACVKARVNVIEHDLNTGLDRFKDQSVDTVVMTQALQTVKRPDQLLEEMLRIGKEAIITFPNFGFWHTRFYLLIRGRMPVSKSLPYAWFDTPNIHLCTFKDFEDLCKSKGLKIEKRTVLNSQHKRRWWINLLPNLFGQLAIYRVSKS